MLDSLRRSYDYLHWADARLLRAAAALQPDDYARDLGASFGSVHGTLAHMVGADWLWLERWQGRSPTSVPGYAEWATAAELDAVWARVRVARSRFLADLTADDLDRVIAYHTLAGDAKSYTLADVLLHGVTHSTYHRGQVTALLRQLGVTPPATDYVLFMDTRIAGA